MSMENSLQFVVGADLTPFNRGIEGAVDRVIGLGKVAVGVGLAAVAAGVGKVGMDSIKAASQMEGFEVMLGTMMGSSEDARARLDELFKFAANSPFNTDQIVDAEVTLRGFGAAAEDVLPGLVDFAATTKADLSQSAIDIGKAWNQGAAGLESDKAKILRSHIELRAGVDVTKMSLTEFRAAMVDTLENDAMWAGGAARMSRTFDGMVSNLQDSWAEFLRDVGKGSELFDNVKGSLQAILDLIQNNQGLIEKFASQFGDVLWEGIRLAATGAAGLADAIRSGYGFANLLAAGMDAVQASALGAAAATGELTAMILRGAGSAEMADTMAAYAGRLNDMATSAKHAATEHFGIATAIAEDMNPATRAMIALLDEAEAAQFDLETGVRSTTGALKEQEDQSDKTGKALKDASGEALTNWLDFYMELTHLRDTDSQKAATWQAEQTQRAEDLTEAMGGDYEDFITLKSAIDAEYYQRLRDISDDYEAHAREEAERTAQERAEFQSRYAMDSLSSFSSLLGTISGMLDDSNAEQKEAAKALAYTQIGIQTAVGIMQAVGSAPWPYNLIPIGFAVATGAAAAIQVDQAHQGFAGVTSSRADQPGETTRRTLDSEGILSSATTRRLGPQGMAALEMGGGGATEITLRLGRVAQREVYRGDRRSNGPMTRDIRRASASQDVATGMSGQRAA